MSDKETRSLLSECRVGRLGCVVNDSPYVVPVSYVFDDDSIDVHSLLGKKVLALRSNPRACFQVDDVEDDYHWRSALAIGSYQEIHEPAERERISRLLLERFPHLTPVESVPVHDGQSSVILFRIRVEELTGMREG